MNIKKTLVITSGEPAGIGPEVSLRAAWQTRHDAACAILGDAVLFQTLANDLQIPIYCHDSIAAYLNAEKNSEKIHLINYPLLEKPILGKPSSSNAPVILKMLADASQACLQGIFSAMVTAPLQKSSIQQSGIAFTGHTEYLAQLTNTAKVVMMLASPQLRVALATTHLPLRAVANAITEDHLLATLKIIHHDLQKHFAIKNPVILVCGLNPHAGENGGLGDEEKTIIEPALNKARALQIDARGPYAADTLFQAKYLDTADCVLAMYHDQALPVLKAMYFDSTVNMTLGLPIIRTSPDHGTALDIAGKYTANINSMVAAILSAWGMAL